MNAYTSTPSSAFGSGCVPGSEAITVGSASQGASLAALANFELNSPKLRCCDLFSIRPWVAMSQNAVEPPLPRITS